MTKKRIRRRFFSGFAQQQKVNTAYKLNVEEKCNQH